MHMYDTRGIGRYSPRLGKVSRGEADVFAYLVDHTVRVCEQLLEINSRYSTTQVHMLSYYTEVCS